MHRFILCLNCVMSPHFEATCCFLCGRRRVAVARYRVICLVLLKNANFAACFLKKNRLKLSFNIIFQNSTSVLTLITYLFIEYSVFVHLVTDTCKILEMCNFHGAFATGVACQQGTLTLPDTWFRPPLWDLLVLQLLRPDSSNLPCLYSTFHLEYSLVLSRFY